jgi:hypothetical protein
VHVAHTCLVVFSTWYGKWWVPIASTAHAFLAIFSNVMYSLQLGWAQTAVSLSSYQFPSGSATATVVLPAMRGARVPSLLRIVFWGASGVLAEEEEVGDSC